MAINVKFDLANNPESATIVLAIRSGKKLGMLNAKEIEINDKFNDVSEISFTLHKYVDGKLTNLWDEVTDFKLVYCKEWDMWFEITVELDEETEIIKTVFCKQLGQAELSQLNLYNIHINDEEDIARKDYKKTILFNLEDTEASLLHRLLKDKAPHYKVTHVDETIAKIQRTFSFDDTSICDSFTEIGEEIGCLFKYPSNSDDNGKIQRTIEVYDLQQNCKDCGHRGEFTDVCPKCGSTNIKPGYGTDTTIFVTADELAAGGIQLTTDTDAVKNCFKLEAGDDLMTATIRNCNPNGTDYIWYFSEAMKNDMSEELAKAIEEYDIKYKEVYDEYTIEDGKIILCNGQNKILVYNTDFYDGDTLVFEYIENDSNLTGDITHYYGTSISKEPINKTNPIIMRDNISHDIGVNEYVKVYKIVDFEESIYKYNKLVSKYEEKYNYSNCLNCNYSGDFEKICPNCNSDKIFVKDKLERINTPIVGYSTLMNAYYNTIDFALFLESGLMPSVVIAQTNAEEQAKLLTKDSLSPVAVNVDKLKSVSLTTANSAVLSMAKVIVKSTFKVEVIESSITKTGTEDNDNTNDKVTWKGKFVITNYSAEEDDVYTTGFITVEINNDEETFIQQKIDKALIKDDTENVSISGLFALNGVEFSNELEKYALKPLESFYDSCEQCLVILQDQGVANKETWGDSTEGASSNLYEKLYLPYYEKSQEIAKEIKIREDELAIIKGVYTVDEEDNKVLASKGTETYIEEYKNKINDELNFEKYIKGINPDLWIEFCAHRREDKYSNDNYISDGLTNAELFDKAREFVDVAEGEIFKSAELQHSISTTLKNLLAIPKFKPLVKYFEVGNWIRVQVDEKVYKLRLLEYSISFDDFDSIPVTFSDVIKLKSGITDVESILSQASSIATTYSSVQRQAIQGEESKTVLNTWFNEGLDATNTKIVGNAQSQNQVWDKNGILCRNYDSITGQYSPEQLKIINSTIAITDDNWATTKTAIGKFVYKDPVTEELRTSYGINGETLVGRLLIGENIILSNSNGRLTFNDNGLVVSNSINKVTISPSDVSLFNIKKNENNIFHVDDKGNLFITGDITATSLTLLDNATVEGGKIEGLADVAITGSYNDLKDRPDIPTLPTFHSVATSGDYNDLKNKPPLSAVATSGSYNDLVDIEELKQWVLDEIQKSIV